MNKYTFELPIEGTCQLSIEAETQEEALAKFRNKDFDDEVPSEWSPRFDHDVKTMGDSDIMDFHLDTEEIEDEMEKACFKININGTEQKVHESELCFQSIVAIAKGRFNPKETYTVTYRYPQGYQGQRDGQLQNNLFLDMVDGLVLNVQAI